MNSKPTPYQVIARKYRPQTFSSVVGQESIVTTLKNALSLGRLAHAYLFCGCRGTGKTTLARVFAKALNCSHPTEDLEPCNACCSCLDINAGRSLDVLEIDGASNRGIDDIRQINETIGYAPASGKYKIYIIDEVHMLTKEAFNALLKTLEEPPVNVKFFFATTEPHKVLPTIISRCQRFDLNRISFEALKNKLTWIASDLNVACEEEVISIVANLSEGSLRDAESMLDQIICYAEHPITAAKVATTLGLVPRSTFFSLDAAFEKQTLSFAFELAGDIFASGKDLSHFIDNLIEHYRSLLKLKLNAPIAFPTVRLKEQYTTSSSLYTEEQCLYILDFLIQWQQQISKTPFKRVSLEMILLHIIRSKYRLTLPSLVKRLHELSQEKPQEIPEVSPIRQEAPSLEETLIQKIQEKIGPNNLKNREFDKEPPQNFCSERVTIAQRQGTSENENSDVADSLSCLDIKSSSPLPPEENPASSLFLSKEKWESKASENETPQIAVCENTDSISENLVSEKPPEPAQIQKPISNSHYDTLMRFAAVELEGTLKKEQI